MFFFDNDTTVETDSGIWDEVHQGCVDMADEVGQATNWMYDTIAERGLPEEIADQIGDQVGGFVENHWEDVCNLPENISNAFDDPIQESTSDFDAGGFDNGGYDE